MQGATNDTKIQSRSPYFLRPTEPVRAKLTIHDRTWAPDVLPDHDRIKDQVVRDEMERAFLKLLRIREDPDRASKTELRAPRALVLEFIQQDCESVLYGETPKHYPTYPHYDQLAKETHEKWKRCGRQEERFSLFSGWHTAYWFDE